METGRLKTFAQKTRTELMGQVSRKLDAVLAPDSAERREAPAAMKALEGRVAQLGKAMVIEQIAYTWFNRFTALRYMDVNGYLTPMVVTAAPDRTRPELLDQAAGGAIPAHVRAPVATRVRDLLEGRAPSREPQLEAYRLLLVATCNHLGGLMPFLFQAIADYTELLMPDALLAPDGWVAQLREVMTAEACQDVEIIGWLYQFYISEKKDQVFAGLKKNQKITAENIPAATQLFTPHWIVRYLVENSLGRLWLLNRPGSKLVERMDYYIAPEGPETDFLQIGKPEEIRICDPACGSGHMLTYAFDLLHAIYEEEGYDPAEIPALILKHNLTGVEIDDRAGALAAFALAMKAAAKLGRRRFLRMEVKPDIVVLQNVTFTPAEMTDVAGVVGRDLFTDELRETLLQFEQAKNFGSLIVPKLRDPAETLRVVEARDFGGDLLLKEVQDRVVAVLGMAETLSLKYHVVVANPPYMGGKGMNGALQDFARTLFPDSKSDLFAMFIQRGFDLIPRLGYSAMVTMQSWMFLSSYEKLRTKIDETATACAMTHMANMVMGIAFGTSATIWLKGASKDLRGAYCHVEYDDIAQGNKPREFPPRNARNALDGAKNRIFWVSTNDYEKVPGSPVAYWSSPKVREVFSRLSPVSELTETREGLTTGSNELFLRYWQEVSTSEIGWNTESTKQSAISGRRWFPYVKGGDFRRWHGNNEYVVNWWNDGAELKFFADPQTGRIRSHNYNGDYGFRRGFSWSGMSSGSFSVRNVEPGFMFDAKGPMGFPFNEREQDFLVKFLNSKVTDHLLRMLAPTMDFKLGHVLNLPAAEASATNENAIGSRLIAISKSDWDAYETSWDFTTLPHFSPDLRSGTLEATYARLRAHWHGMTDEMKRLEEENNRIFIDVYGLQDELIPEVALEEITLTCNPAYRYGVNGTEEEREARLLADTMKELISHAIGCMFGRYSLDAPGLILANQGDTLQDYLARVPSPTFRPDKDNVIPLLEEDRFEDDAYQRFREFLVDGT